MPTISQLMYYKCETTVERKLERHPCFQPYHKPKTNTSPNLQNPKPSALPYPVHPKNPSYTGPFSFRPNQGFHFHNNYSHSAADYRVSKCQATSALYIEQPGSKYEDAPPHLLPLNQILKLYLYPTLQLLIHPYS